MHAPRPGRSWPSLDGIQYFRAGFSDREQPLRGDATHVYDFPAVRVQQHGAAVLWRRHARLRFPAVGRCRRAPIRTSPDRASPNLNVRATFSRATETRRLWRSDWELGRAVALETSPYSHGVSKSSYLAESPLWVTKLLRIGILDAVLTTTRPPAAPLEGGPSRVHGGALGHPIGGL